MDNIDIKKTIDYYNLQSYSYFKKTFNIDMSVLYDKFLQLLNHNATHILDVGSGSGRDTLFFINKGFNVTALEPSEELAHISQRIIGDIVEIKRVQDINFINLFDGIWACASLLHVPFNQMNEVLSKLYKALKPKGILYMSFKYGDFEGIRDQRYFCDYTIEKFNQLSYKDIGFTIVDLMNTNDLQNRQSIIWLNIFLQKQKVD